MKKILLFVGLCYFNITEPIRITNNLDHAIEINIDKRTKLNLPSLFVPARAKGIQTDIFNDETTVLYCRIDNKNYKFEFKKSLNELNAIYFNMLTLDDSFKSIVQKKELLSIPNGTYFSIEYDNEYAIGKNSTFANIFKVSSIGYKPLGCIAFFCAIYGRIHYKFKKDKKKESLINHDRA